MDKTQQTLLRSVIAHAHPNLALVKYWGKVDSLENLPATPSIGISLAAFTTSTRVRISEPESGSGNALNPPLSWNLRINGIDQTGANMDRFFNQVTEVYTGAPVHAKIESSNDFPTAAGLASSASGFAALAAALNRAMSLGLDDRGVSELARIGSGSASRSVFPGFVSFPAGSPFSQSLYGPEHWPELRCIIVMISNQKKRVSSRKGMEDSRLSSPYYPAWLKDSTKLYREAEEAIAQRNIARLGPVIRRSYLRMFSTMFSSDDPLIYWKEGSIRLIHMLESLREKGVQAWETMDAGPQVKIITTASEVDDVLAILHQASDEWEISVSSVGGGVEVRDEDK